MLLLELLHVGDELPDDVIPLCYELLERLVQVVLSEELSDLALLGVQLCDLLLLLIELVALTLYNRLKFHAFLS